MMMNSRIGVSTAIPIHFKAFFIRFCTIDGTKVQQFFETELCF
jgi:hypothetical protein